MTSTPRYVTPTTPTPWQPSRLVHPPRMIYDVPTAWDEMELCLESLVEEFCPSRAQALEFGVQHGYSTVALSNYFAHITGVDTCVGDPYAGTHEDIYEWVLDKFKPFPNITMVRSDWESWAAAHADTYFDLIHVDIYHTWEQTYACGKWAACHSPVVIFHDTLSFPAVGLAVGHLAAECGRKYYNWSHKHGLGILV